MKMFTLATVVKSLANVEMGVAIDSAMVESILATPVNFEDRSGLGIEKFNFKASCVPVISKAKEFDASKPAFIGMKISEDGQYLNCTLGNVEPKRDLAVLPEVAALFTTRFNANGADTAAKLQAEAINAIKKATKTASTTAKK